MWQLNDGAYGMKVINSAGDFPVYVGSDFKTGIVLVPGQWAEIRSMGVKVFLHPRENMVSLCRRLGLGGKGIKMNVTVMEMPTPKEVAEW